MKIPPMPVTRFIFVTPRWQMPATDQALRILEHEEMSDSDMTTAFTPCLARDATSVGHCLAIDGNHW
jgi:hypothetical protein